MLITAALMLAACGTDGSGGSTTEALADPPTTSSIVPTTTTLSVPDDPLSAELGFVTPVPIEAPVGFPNLEQLVELIETQMRQREYPRARVVDGWIGSDELGTHTITYYDNYTIRDYPGGRREVDPGDGMLLVQDDSGNWVDSDRFEFSIAEGFPDWRDVYEVLQYEVLPRFDPELVGYEMIVGVPTAHFQIASERESGRSGTDFWVDEKGVVLRLVMSTPSQQHDGNAYLIWNVETLEPDLEGPLPPAPAG